MSWWSRFVVGFVIYILETLIYGSIIFRWIFNNNINTSLFIIKWFPFLAIPRFGFQASYVRILTRDDD
uniref:Uncharacterized protein n=2 Tax=Lutzomyia longipalpis TaxID=7200 RepID=A0A7G3B845_LUTLO